MTRVPGRRKGVFLSGAEASSRETPRRGRFRSAVGSRARRTDRWMLHFTKVMTDESVRIYKLAAVPSKGIKMECPWSAASADARHTRDVAMVTPVNATDNPVDPESAEEKPKVRAIHRRARLSAVTAPRIWLTSPAPSTPLPPLRSSSTRRTRTSSSRSCSWAGPRSAVPPRTSASSRRRSWRCARGARRDAFPSLKPVPVARLAVHRPTFRSFAPLTSLPNPLIFSG